jgi:hypothetical protein
MITRIAALILIVLAAQAGACRADQARDGRLDPEVLRKVKRATVYLRVTLPEGQVVQGSGFFGSYAGLVMTNAHVLGMLRPESRKPAKVEVVINSGEKDERTLPGQVLGTDPDSDLGLILVRGKDLPEPLKVDEHKPLQETDPVFIFGFPFGKELGKNVTVSKSAVSSLRKDDKGQVLRKIQVDGGMNPGNSGGPVIVPSGEVVGVAVSGIKNSNINFAVPARSVAFFLLGRGRVYSYGTAYKDGDKVKVPVRVEMVDPLKRVNKIWYDTWLGDPGKPRDAIQFKPEPMPGDLPREKAALTYQNGVAEGELALPAEPPQGKVFWIQFMYTSGSNKTAWNTATVFRPMPPVERKPTMLKHEHRPGGRAAWKLNSTVTLKIRDEDDIDHQLSLNLNCDLIATAAEKIESGTLTTTLKLSKLTAWVSLDKKPLEDGKEDEQLKKELSSVELTVRENEKGGLVFSGTKMKQLSPSSLKRWRGLTDQMIASLEAVVFPLPGEEVAFGRKWNSILGLTIPTLGALEKATADVSNEYLGVRKRLGRDEAVVHFRGEVRNLKSAGRTLTGKMRGEAWIDVAAGQVVMCRNQIDVDLEIMMDRQKAKAGGILEVRLDRALPKEEKALEKE